MIYDHLNSKFLSAEGVVNVILAYIEQDGDRFYNFVEENGKRRRRTRTNYNPNNVDDLW
jgi:hypothetical protein